MRSINGCLVVCGMNLSGQEAMRSMNGCLGGGGYDLLGAVAIANLPEVHEEIR
jgi:hypothetical protein